MKNIVFMGLILLFCFGSIQLAGVLQSDKHINHTQFNNFKRVNKRAKVFPGDFPGQRLQKRNISCIFTVNRSEISRRHYFDIFKKIECRKDKNKINKSLLATHKNLSTKKKRHQIEFETNKFEDKNGDGINDIVANPKL